MNALNSHPFSLATALLLRDGGGSEAVECNFTAERCSFVGVVC